MVTYIYIVKIKRSKNARWINYSAFMYGSEAAEEQTRLANLGYDVDVQPMIVEIDRPLAERVIMSDDHVKEMEERYGKPFEYT